MFKSCLNSGRYKRIEFTYEVKKVELWYTEKQTEAFGITAKIKQTLHTEQTEFQKLDMIETEEFGNMLSA